MTTDAWPLAVNSGKGRKLCLLTCLRVSANASQQDLNEFRGGCSVLSLKLTPAEAFDEPLSPKRSRLGEQCEEDRSSALAACDFGIGAVPRVRVSAQSSFRNLRIDVSAEF